MQATAAAPARASLPRPASAPSAGRAAQRAGWAVGGFVGLFLLFDGGARLAGLAPYLEGTVQFGYPLRLAPWIGAALLVSTLLYLLPRTAVLGAILVTGYLGGASAAHARLEDPWFLFPIVLAALAWGGLWLRDPRLRALLPVRVTLTRRP